MSCLSSAMRLGASPTICGHQGQSRCPATPRYSELLASQAKTLQARAIPLRTPIANCVLGLLGHAIMEALMTSTQCSRCSA
eukprot:5430214-Amphidinium_carterae.1